MGNIIKTLPLVDAINFNIKCSTTPPANLTENTLWVNTTTPIHYWSIGKNSPCFKSNNKNFICYPYAYSTSTINDVVFTVKPDGSVIANGTSNSNGSTFRIATPTAKANIRYIRDSVNGNSSNKYSHWIEIQAYDKDKNNIALNKTVSLVSGTIGEEGTNGLKAITNGTISTSGGQYAGASGEKPTVQIDLGDFYDIKSIKVWHYYSGTRTYYNPVTQVSANGVDWVTISDGKEYVETSDGKEWSCKNVPCLGNAIFVPAGTYTFSGCPKGGSTSTYYMAMYIDNDSVDSTAGVDTGDGVTFTLTKDSYLRSSIIVNAGVSVSNLTFKPQLEKGSVATSFIKGDATGQLWVQEEDTSPININALKKNILNISPYQIKQYENGEWIIKNGRRYKNKDDYVVFSDYLQLEYIETTGTQYIDTDITVFNQSAFSIDYVAAFTAVNYSYNCVWSTTGGDENYQIWVYSDGRLAYKWGSGTAVRSSSVKADTSKHTYTFNKNANAISLSVDGTQKLSSTNSGTLNKPIRLFTKDKSYYGKAKIYEIKIYVAGILLYHLIPAKRISDDTIGLRDILNDKFYTNAGTGTFGAGSIKAFLE